MKVVVDDDDNAIYFSRSPCLFPRRRQAARLARCRARSRAGFVEAFSKHTGLYVYRRDVLLEFTRWPQTQLERIEALEQLRALAHGVKIKVVEACHPQPALIPCRSGKGEKVAVLKRMNVNDWIGLAIIGFWFCVACLVCRSSASLTMFRSRVRTARTGRTGLLGAGLVGLQKALDPAKEKAAEVIEDLKQGRYDGEQGSGEPPDAGMTVSGRKELLNN